MLLAVCLLLLTASNTKAEECTTLTTEVAYFPVYYGWPFTYQCLNIFANIEYPEDLEEYGEYTCVISEASTGKVIFNSSFSGSYYEMDFPVQMIEYRFTNISKDTPLEYTTKLQNSSSCWIENVTLEPQVLERESCEENLNKTETNDIEKVSWSIFQAPCDVPRGLDLPLELADNSVASIYWLYNCDRKLPSNTYRKQNDDALYFQNISYESNPGVYTCVVEYANMKRYRIHTKMCVKVPSSRITTVLCDDKRSAIGGDVEIECTVDAGVGIENSLVIFGRINKLNASGAIDDSESKLACIAQADAGKRNISKRRSTCELTTLNRGKDDIDCFYKQPTKTELAKQRTTLRLALKIRNVKESDFATYQVTITRAGNQVTSTFTIKHDKASTLVKPTVILIVAISVTVGFILFLIMLCVLCGVEIRWICFKIFRRKETDVKTYSAYITYYYSQDMSHTNSSHLKSFVSSLMSQLQRIGGKVFNESEELSNQQYKVESIVSKLSDCHRVVILLTSEYINDEWSVLETAQAWRNVIEDGIKIIFITFPETKSAIENLHQEPRNFLKAALKSHKAVKWSGNLPLTRKFRMQLEMYMPKLPENCSMEMQSTTPSNEAPPTKTKQNGHSFFNASSQIDTNGNVQQEGLYANGV